MEGLEISEIDFFETQSIVDFRIDSNTYLKEYLESDKLIELKNPLKIGCISKSVQNFGAYSLTNFINFIDSGIPFLMTENIRHNYIDWDIHKYVDKESHEMLYKSHCRKGQVLITMAGEYLGRVAVYNKDEICSSNQAIAKITLNPEHNPYIVSTFLNSEHGQNQINRLKTITGQPNINMSLIKELKIPDFSFDIGRVIEGLISLSIKKRETASHIYNQAEQILMEEICLQDYIVNQGQTNIKTLKESFLETGRLDAEYYQKKYDEIINHITQNYNYELLGDLVDVNKSFEPGSDYYRDSGIPFYRVSDITKSGLSKPAKYLPDNFVEGNDSLVPKKNTILFSKDGSVGIAYKLEEKLDGFTSSALLHLNVKSSKVNADYLTLSLNSIVVQMQAERDAGGSIIQHWKPSEIKDVIVPIISDKKQLEIQGHIQQSFALKKQCEQLLEIAKLGVEKAIEENEESAINCINDKLEELGVKLNTEKG
ncbi:restriction endonuclease subunit S [Flagellimonas sp. S3867]|uniref:restriction endonuclease subunit S n=1 Tax=Flagellimonas sp. S3867 TaxID=2768063 RepID=UPI001CC24120|nr:restriction endonuclease subunit S [Flagellimonas sp. S3867]